MAVACVLPTVARDLVRAPDAARGEHDRFRPEQLEPAALPFVGERAHHPAEVGQQREHRAFHVHVDALVHAVVLQRPDHLQTGAIADVGEPRVFVPAEIPLQDAAVVRSIEQRAPCFQRPDFLRRLSGVQFRHPPVVDVLAAAHGVGKMHLPVVAVVHVGERCSDPALGHHRVGLAEERFADDGDGHALGGGLDRGAQSGAACANHQDIMFVR